MFRRVWVERLVHQVELSYMGVQRAIHENVQIVWQTVLCCYATRRTHARNIQTTLHYAPATATSATAALATASASFAGVVRRLARTAATTSAGATDCTVE